MNIIIPSRSIKQQCQHLALVLSSFCKHNLCVKASEFTTGAAHGTLLGHVVSSQRVHTDPNKIQAVYALPEPTTIQQVRSFLELAC